MCQGLGVRPAPAPPHNAQKKKYPSYYKKGLYNALYGRAGYHHPYPTRGERALMDWAKNSIPGGRYEGGGGE